jgi:hypothetical protein
MRRFLGHLTWAVSMGVLLASIGAGEAKAGPQYQISVTIDDTTTNTVTNFPLPFGSPNNTFNPSNPNMILASSGFDTSATGVAITGLQAQSSSNALDTSLTTQATATVQNASTDHYIITITTFNNGYTQPVGPQGTIQTSSSGTYTFAPGGTQTYQGWYNPTNPTVPTLSGPNPGLQSFAINSTSTTVNSNNSGTASTGFSPFVQPYALTSTLVINVSGNGSSGNNSQVAVQGTTTITAVPEPASLVMFLTGMPMPLVVLGMLRRRKAQRKADLVA